jgi:hypothetical protein
MFMVSDNTSRSFHFKFAIFHFKFVIEEPRRTQLQIKNEKSEASEIQILSLASLYEPMMYWLYY